MKIIIIMCKQAYGNYVNAGVTISKQLATFRSLR